MSTFLSALWSKGSQGVEQEQRSHGKSSEGQIKNSDLVSHLCDKGWVGGGTKPSVELHMSDIPTFLHQSVSQFLGTLLCDSMPRYSC